MEYKIDVKQIDDEVKIDIISRHGMDRHFDISVDKDGLHIMGSDSLYATWDASNKMSIDTVS